MVTLPEDPEPAKRAPASDSEVFEQERSLAEGLNEGTAAMLFQTVESRRYMIDQMMWQVPALTLTAEAFLLQIAYGASSRWISRLVTAMVGMIASAAGVQLLLRHRFREEIHSYWLEQFADAQRWPNVHNPARAEAFAFNGKRHPDNREPEFKEATESLESQGKRQESWRKKALAALSRLRRRLSLKRSPGVWIGALSLFGLASLVVVLGWVDHVFTGSNPF